MDLARVDGEAEALEDRLAVDLGVEVFDFQHQRERFFFERWITKNRNEKTIASVLTKLTAIATAKPDQPAIVTR
ncbi:hypothetical protein SAQ01S_24280 [Sphingomonas aquatilis NBRC 16722]|nr:hypothetical protein SAQ01S_24280 [Sphingomonas aquatilis NBRC 16722]